LDLSPLLATSQLSSQSQAWAFFQRKPLIFFFTLAP